MNRSRKRAKGIFRLREIRPTVFLVSLLAVVIAYSSDAAERSRIWVDANGLFSVEARLIQIAEDSVVLLRKDGQRIKIEFDKLSERDKEYVEDLGKRSVTEDNPLRLAAPKPPETKPLPTLDLPPAREVAEEGSTLQLSTPAQFTLPSESPRALTPDPSPSTFGVVKGRIAIRKVDVYDKCSRPIPVVTMTESGTRSTSVAMSTSSGIQYPGSRPRNQLVRFDLDEGKSYITFEHPEPIELMDHHVASGRSLLLVGFNSLRKGGELVIATGWDQKRIRLSHRRTLSETIQARSVPHVRWARWVDDEHVIAVIEQTLGLWNIVSGDQVYSMDGIGQRSEPAISGGRRYVAVPYEGSVQLFSTQTGKPLGRIAVDKQVVPGVGFSPRGNTLAVVTSRRMRNWDLASANFSADIESRRSLGTGRPIWIDSDLILSSSGVLLSVFRGLPLWSYDVAGTERVTIGKHVALFRKHPVSELTVLSLPHDAATDAMYWLDNSPTKVDTEKWRVLGRSIWKADGWTDRDVQISAAADRLR